VGDHGQVPTRQRAVPSQGCPAAAHVIAAQARFARSQPRPTAQSLSTTQLAPACPALWHVDALDPGATGHTSDPLQSLVSAHGAPAAPGALQAPTARLQLRPGLHCACAPLHFAPASPKVTGRHMPVVPPSAEELISQVVSGPHVASAQFEPVAHLPHTMGPPPSGASEPAVQSPFWHWSSLTQEAPTASDPGPNAHAGPRSAEHPDAARAFAQASSALGVTEIPGSATTVVHTWSKRAWMRVLSLEGRGAPLQLPE